MSLMLNDELVLENNTQYKNFVIAIEKVLKQFESSNEWADLITNLSKIKKVKFYCRIFFSFFVLMNDKFHSFNRRIHFIH